jgi:hypothetical protein
VESVQRTLHYSYPCLGPSPHDYPRIQLLHVTLDLPILPTLSPLLYSNSYTPCLSDTISTSSCYLFPRSFPLFHKRGADEESDPWTDSLPEDPITIRAASSSSSSSGANPPSNAKNGHSVSSQGTYILQRILN